MSKVFKRFKSTLRFNSCISGNKSPVRNDVLPTQEKEEVESLESYGSDVDTHALYNIREQMAISLNKMKDLEEQVKTIPVLQKQLSSLKEEKKQLQLRLQKEEALHKLNSAINNKRATITFTPQKISPVLLESLGSRIQQKPVLPDRKIKRDIGVMCTQHTKDASTLASPAMVRSIGINSTSTNGVYDSIYTKQELEHMIAVSLRNHHQKAEANKRLNSVSVATQMVPKGHEDVKHSFVQTIPVNQIVKMSQGIMVCPSQRDAITSCKPEMRTIGLSDHKTTDIICDKCSVTKRTVACGPDPEETRTYLSLKSLDMPSRSLSFALGENEKLNIRRKTTGTQYQLSVEGKGVQCSVDMDSVGIQNSVICLTKSSQCVAECTSKSIDTSDLIDVIDSHANTDEFKDTLKSTRDNSSNTDAVKIKESGTNTLPAPSTYHASSNTEKILKKDVGCGDVVKPHISIACADNYCDSCKDAIKNLAKEFSKVLTSPVLGGASEQSKIPRPTTLTSPRPVRKKFMRQNTYTISSRSPSSSPKAEKHTISASATKTLSSSLDSVSTSRSPTGTSKGDECLVRSLHEEASTSKEKQESKLDKSWNLDLPANIGLNGSNATEKERLCDKDISQQVENTMLLNQIATSTSEPRTKTTPSKEVKAALKVINDSLQKSTMKSNNLKNASAIVQKEWFRISSTDKANPLDVEDYLDCFEEYSNSLLRYVVNMTDVNGNTAMHYAVSHGNFDVVSILLDSKVCNVNQTNNAGYTCVMLVSLAKLKNSAHRTVVQRLFQMADVNIRAKKHCQTALMLAVSHGNLDMVELLLNAGADINIQDEDGSTALMCAAEHGHIDIVKHLLSQPDCDSLIQDVDGSTAFKIAWQAGHRDIGLLLYVHEQMLRSKMPNKGEPKSPATPRRPKPPHHQSQ